MLFVRPRLSTVIAALRCLATVSQVTGSVQTIPPFWPVATLYGLKSSAAEKSPSVQALGGCGRGRFSDPKTHSCRGPPDIQKSSP
jgi:hypothetical protein